LREAPPEKQWHLYIIRQAIWNFSLKNMNSMPCSSPARQACTQPPELTVSFLACAVQHQCIPQAILGMDVLCQAKSGMGKTAVFVLSVLQQLEPVPGQVAAVIICHTRELAFQVPPPPSHPNTDNLLP